MDVCIHIADILLLPYIHPPFSSLFGTCSIATLLLSSEIAFEPPPPFPKNQTASKHLAGFHIFDNDDDLKAPPQSPTSTSKERKKE